MRDVWGEGLCRQLVSDSVTNVEKDRESAADRPASIRRAVTRLSSRLRAERPAGAMSGNKVTVLAHLHRHGPSTAGAVAAAAHQQPQSLTRTFNELQLAGLIARRPGEHDRRESVLTLSDAGREALFRDMADRDTWLQEALGGLTEAEVEILRIASGLMEQLSALDITTAQPKADRHEAAAVA
jgi:DNA-binding MarR family transcriptional regulator